MNREQRRLQARADAQERKRAKPVRACSVKGLSSIKPGDKVTIAGLRWYGDEWFTWDCKPGKETVHVVSQPI